MKAFKQKSLKSFKIIVFTKNCEILVFERRRLDHQKSYHSQVSQNEFKRIIMAWARATDPARGPRVGDLLQDTETNNSVQSKLCKERKKVQKTSYVSEYHLKRSEETTQ